MKKISVIVPVYNTSKYLRKCLDSIINQTYQNLEIILIDDKSIDNSLSICKEYQKKDSRIIVLKNKKNMGISYTKNIGVNKSSGDYLTFVDSDDYLDIGLYSYLEKYMNQGIELIKFNFQMVDQNYNNFDLSETIELTKTTGIKATKVFITKRISFHMSWVYLYKTSFYKVNSFKFPINRINEDDSLTPIILFNAKSIISVNYIGYYYYLNLKGIMHTFSSERMFMDGILTYDSSIEYFKKFNNNDANYFIEYYSKIIVWKYFALSISKRIKYIDYMKKRNLLSFKPRNVRNNLFLFINKIINFF